MMGREKKRMMAIRRLNVGAAGTGRVSGCKAGG